MQKKKQSSVAILFLIAAVVLTVAYFSGEDKTNRSAVTNPRVPSSAVVGLPSSSVNPNVNKHLEQTANKLWMDQQKIEIENKMYAPELTARPQQRAIDNKTTGFDLGVDQTSLQTARDLGRVQDNTGEPLSPRDIVRQEQYEQLQLSEYKESYRREYIRQFIENARKKGYELQVDNQGKVTSVKKIRNENGFQIFGGSRGGSNH